MCWSLDQWRRRIGLGGHGGYTTGTIVLGRSNAERSAKEDENNCPRAQRERNEREREEFVNAACRQAREEEQVKKFLLSCALFCITQIQRQGLEFPVEFESTTTETTSSDEHVVDRVESVVETISTSSIEVEDVVETISTSSSDLVVEVDDVVETICTSSNDPVVEAESSSMHLVEVDLPETSEGCDGCDMSVGSSVSFDQLTDDLFLEIDDDGADLVIEPSSQLFDSDDESSSGKYEYALF